MSLPSREQPVRGHRGWRGRVTAGLRDQQGDSSALRGQLGRGESGDEAGKVGLFLKCKNVGVGEFRGMLILRVQKQNQRSFKCFITWSKILEHGAFTIHQTLHLRNK